MESVSYATPASPGNGNRQHRPREHVPNILNQSAPTHLQEHPPDDLVSIMSTTLTITEAAPTSTISSEHSISLKPSKVHRRFPSFTKPHTEVPIPNTTTTALSQKPTPLLKKQSSSIFGFLRTKEPSTQAFKAYQEAIRKQAGNGRLTAVGMPMVSSAKLPANVPKVNSKWDGVPEVLKEKKSARGRDSPSFHSRSSSRSVGRAPSAMSTHSKQGSITSVDARSIASSSNQSSGPDLVWTPSDIGTKGFASMLPKDKSSRPQTPLSDISSFTPSLTDHQMSQEVRDNSPKTYFSNVPPIPAIPSIHTPPRESPSTHRLHVTPQSTRWDRVGVILTPDSSNETINSDTQSTTLTFSSRQAIVKSSGYGVLGPPMSAQKKPHQETSGSDHRPSALKQTPWGPAQSGPLRPALSLLQLGGSTQASTSTYLRNRAVAPWDSPATATFHDRDMDNVETALPLSPQGNKGLFRKAKSSLFKS